MSRAYVRLGASVKGSLQLRCYLAARRAGVGLEEAASASNIGHEEARLHDEAEAAGEYADIDLSEPARIGHNSGETTMATNVAADQLRLFLERIERLKEEIKGLSDDVRDVFAEAKSQGYDVPTMREMLKLRAMDKAKRDEKQALIETYGTQLGLF